MKIQTKTTLLFTTLTLAVFVMLTFVVYYFANEFAYNDFYKRLELRARISAKFVFEKDHVSTESFKVIQQEYLERLPDEKSFVIQLDQQAKPLNEYPKALPMSYLNSIRRAGGETVYFRDNFVHYAGILYRDKKANYLVIESATNTYGSEIISRLGNILIITLIASTIIMYSVGIYFAKRTFRPFRKITNSVRAISEGNLQLRLEAKDGVDEISELITTFNVMLDRMETAFETQNNFVSNASHEFRTPLTSIVAEADYALSRERSPEVYQQSLSHIMRDAEKLQHLTRGLLSLAQTGFDGSKQRWEQIRVDEILYEVKNNIAIIVPDAHVVLQIQHLPVAEEDARIYGNEDLLKIALGNILLNAAKYSVDEPIIVDLFFENDMQVIRIADKGIGIPKNEMRHIYDPFFRASNTTSFEGYGIGLPLARNIVRMHRGSIDVVSELGKGTTVTLSFPRKRSRF